MIGAVVVPSTERNVLWLPPMTALTAWCLPATATRCAHTLLHAVISDVMFARVYPGNYNVHVLEKGLELVRLASFLSNWSSFYVLAFAPNLPSTKKKLQELHYDLKPLAPCSYK
jgi:hypothetical protein